MTDLWHEASEDHGLIARQAALARAEGELAPLWDFFFQASSGRELEHRLAIGETRLFSVASKTGVEIGDLEEMIRRRHTLLREALTEGQDPVAPMVGATPQGGGGPEKPDEHAEGPDFSHGYSEVPMGAPGGPVPQVTQPVFDRPSQPSEATAAKKCSCGKKLRNGKCKGCAKSSYKCDCTPAGASDDEDGPGPGGRTSARTAAGTSQMTTVPAGVGQGTSSPDGVTPGSMSMSAPSSAAPSAGTQTSSRGGYDLTPSQEVTAARRDPVADHIRLVASSVAASNPGLPAAECRRVARLVVARYLRRADLASSVMSDDPGGGSGGGGGGGGGHMGEYMMGRQLVNKIPGGGGGGAAGGAAELGEVAELAAL